MDKYTVLMEDTKTYFQSLVMFHTDGHQRQNSYYEGYQELEQMVGRIRNQMLSFPVCTTQNQDGSVSIDYEAFSNTRDAYMQSPHCGSFTLSRTLVTG